MKTYRNERLGFEMEIPDGWPLSASVTTDELRGVTRIVFGSGSDETVSLEIRTLGFEPRPEQIVDEISRHVEAKGYTGLTFGRLRIGGKDHVWARYFAWNGAGTKQYRIVLGATEYALVAATIDRDRLFQREAIWDATANSFRLLAAPPAALAHGEGVERPSSDSEDPVEKAIALHRRLWEAHPREANPRLWALGLCALADDYEARRQGNRAENLQQAARFFQQAQEVFTREAAPDHWAGIQNSLGEIYRHLSLVSDRARNLNQALGHYQGALTVTTRQANPELWAAIHNNLGIVYAKGVDGDPAENVEQAIAHCQQALEVYLRATHPDDWAMTQNNLGTAWRQRVQGDRADNIEQAMAHFKLALEVQDRQPDRAQWAGTHYNLALAYRDRLRGDPADNAEHVIRHLQHALEVYTRAADPVAWADAEYSLSQAYSGRRRGDRAENIEQAIDHALRALQVFTIPSSPLQWAAINMNLAFAYQDRQRGEKAGNQDRAIGCLRQALEGVPRESRPEQWAVLQNSLACAYANRRGGDRAENLDRALYHCQQALEVHTREANPREWAIHQMLLASICLERKRGERAEYTGQAVHYFQQALEVFSPERYPEEWAQAQGGLALARQARAGGDKEPGANPASMSPALSYPAFYWEEFEAQPGPKRPLKLVNSAVLDSPFVANLILVYEWEAGLSDDEAKHLAARAIAYVACAIFDAAADAHLPCQPSQIPNGRRPAWMLQGERAPVSLTLSDIDPSDRTCQLTIGAVVVAVGRPTGDKRHWEKLHAAFKRKFRVIMV